MILKFCDIVMEVCQLFLHFSLSFIHFKYDKLTLSFRPAIKSISVVVYNFLVRIGVCKTPVRTYDVGSSSGITISLPGTSPNDAERRRYHKIVASLHITLGL